MILFIYVEVVLRCIFLQRKFKSTKKVSYLSWVRTVKSRHCYLNIFQRIVKMFHNIAVITRSVADKALGMISVQVLLLSPVSCPLTNALCLHHTSTDDATASVC